MDRPFLSLFLSTIFLATPPTGAWAAPENIDNGVPTTIPVEARMDNNFAVDVTDVDIGTIAAINASGETATLTIAPNGTLDETTGNAGSRARLVSNGNDANPGTLDIAGGLTDQLVTIRYGNMQNLTCVSGCTGTPPALIIAAITDDSADQAASWSVDDATPDASATPGQFTTSGTGSATVNIGISIRTDGSGTPYPSGTYEGSFDVTLEY